MTVKHCYESPLFEVIENFPEGPVMAGSWDVPFEGYGDEEDIA